MRVLVITVVHDPRDARISRRQIPAILAAGHHVTYAAPFSDIGAAPPSGVSTIDLPRSHGRHRVAALRAARDLLKQEASEYDVVLMHDPELVLAAELAGIANGPTSRPVVVWDVHEDTGAALTLKGWLPTWARSPVASGVNRLESHAESRMRLILAEEGYRGLFSTDHPIVPNSTPAPTTVIPSGDARVVYVGALTIARGARDMVEVGRLLADDGVEVHLVGTADTAAREVLQAGSQWVTWHGFLPNDQALGVVDGALAGLSLLHDEPNYRHSRPTKVIEYMAHGVPVISTPTPPAVELVQGNDCGIIVPFNDPQAVADAVRTLRENAQGRQAMADRGRAAALRDHDWNTDGARFVQQLQDWVSAAH